MDGDGGGVGFPVRGFVYIVPLCLGASEVYSCKAGAAIEGITADGRHAAGNRDVRKASAIIESTFADARHAIGDSDAGEARATSESIFADARHAAWDGDGC